MTAADPLAAALSDRYAIERELGQGGMATVYLARDLRHERHVAVKVLRPELAASLGAERFLREIKLAAKLQHPHILPLHDSGEAGGFLYYVMPYVDGESLRARLARGGELPIHDAIKILIEVTDALAFAHGQGVVHRDIKPDNVLLSRKHALVTDFGIAKAVSEATGRQQITTAGIALGTPIYMAPEQATADPAVDHRADIYAVGVMGYELIAGRPPFSGRTSQEVLAAHVMQAPLPLCARRTACPPGLEAVIMRCLEKRPADRWQSADELLAQLEPLATPSGGTTPTTHAAGGGAEESATTFQLEEMGRACRGALRRLPSRSCSCSIAHRRSCGSAGGLSSRSTRVWSSTRHSHPTASSSPTPQGRWGRHGSTYARWMAPHLSRLHRQRPASHGYRGGHPTASACSSSPRVASRLSPPSAVGRSSSCRSHRARGPTAPGRPTGARSPTLVATRYTCSR